MAKPRFQVGLDLSVGLPQNEFKEKSNDTGFGLSGEFLASLGRSPFLIGGSLGFMIYGSETRKEPFSTTIPDVTVDVTTTNNMLLGHFLLRAQPSSGGIRPYVDGLLGFNYLFTETRIQSERNYVEEEVASSTNFDDFAFSYGGGGGVLVKVYDGSEKDVNPFRVFVDLKVRYLQGSKAQYLKEGSIHREGGNVDYEVYESTTDLVVVSLGAILEF
jgi:hypothetical protein